MSQYKLFASDMDGTFLDNQKRISPENISAVNRALNLGREFVLASGRTYAELTPALRELPGIRYAVMSNGAHVMDLLRGKNIVEETLTDEDILTIIDAAQDLRPLVQLMSDRPIIDRYGYAHLKEYHLDQYYELFTETAQIVDNVRDFYLKEHPAPYDINLYFTSVEARDEAFSRLKHLDLATSDSEETGQQFYKKGVDKGEGLRRLCEYLGIPLEQAIAIGDADNDLPMVEAAGLGIAMANANRHVLACADAVVTDNEHSGVAEAINKYLLK